MPIKVACQCGRQLMVSDNRAGHTVQCPKCTQLVQVPGERPAEPVPAVLPTVVPPTDAVEKPVVAPPPISVAPPSIPEPPVSAQKQEPKATPNGTVPLPVKIPSLPKSEPPPPPPLPASLPPAVVAKPKPAEPPAPIAEPAPPPRVVDPPAPAGVAALENKPEPEAAPEPPPPSPPTVASAPAASVVSVSEQPEKPKQEAAETVSETPAPVAASAPASAPAPEPLPPPSGPEPTVPPPAKATSETSPPVLAPPPAVPAKKPTKQPARSVLPGLPTSIDELVSIRPGYRPDADKLSAAYVLSMLLVVLGVVSMVPGVLEVIRFLRDTDSFPLGRWAFSIFFLGLLHFAYALYLGQLPDWSAAWVITSATLLQGAVYASVLTALYLVGGQSQLVEALDLGPHVDNGHARAWCFVMLCLNSVVAYYCGRVSMRWRRAFVLLRSAHRS
jgi:hypothetical protein